MSDNFVDVSYRGLEVGRQLKLCALGPTTGYIEHATPLPVGTVLTIATNEGPRIIATVTHVQERVAGVDEPGMRVRRLDESTDAGSSWWGDRVTEVDSSVPLDGSAAANPDLTPLPISERSEPPAAESPATEARAPKTIKMDVVIPPDDVTVSHDTVSEDTSPDETAPVTANDDTIDEDDSSTESGSKPAGKKKRRRKKKEGSKTTVMQAVDLDNLVEETKSDSAPRKKRRKRKKKSD